MRSWIKRPLGGIVAMLLVATGTAAIIFPVATGGGGGGQPACTQTFAPGNIGTTPYSGDNVNTAAQNGTTSTVLCFSSGTYNSIILYSVSPSGSGHLLMRPADGATVDLGQIDANGIRRVKIDGFEGSSHSNGMILKDTGLQTNQNVTFSNNRMTDSGVTIRDGRSGSGPVLITENSFVGFTTAGEQSRLLLQQNCPAPQNITISNNVFGEGQSDGMDFSATCGATITNNEVYGINQSNCGGIHCDAIQDNGGSSDMVLTNNFLHDNDQGIMAYDGTGSGWVVRNNVVEATAAAGNAINLGGSPSPVVEHNTLTVPGSYINFGSKSGQQSTNVTVRDNIAPGGVLSNGEGTAATFTVRDFNMCTSACAGGGSNNVVGSPTFVGGGSPTTFAGFALAGGSAGENDASDGTDIGVNP